MAKSRNQKGKILVLEHLLQGTGESRIVTMQEILDKLLEYGITAERKSIYDDIEALREFGQEIAAAPESVHTKEEAGISKNAETEKKSEPVIIYKENTLDKEEIQNTEKAMKLQCDASREKEIREYFGSYGEYKLKESGYFHVTVPHIAGPKFYGWLAMMGKDVHILKPKKTAASYRDYLKTLAKEYKGV